MSDAPTTPVEIETELLEQLRAGFPGKTDRELVEDAIVIHVGFATIRRVQQRSNLSEEEAMEIAVRAVHDVRRELRESESPAND